MDLNSPVNALPLVGSNRAKALAKLGIATIEDLLSYYPRKYINLTKIKAISQIQIGEKVVIKGKLSEPNLSKTSKRKLSLITCDLFDESAKISCLWFNQPYIIKTLKKLDEVYLYGYVGIFNHKKVLQPLLLLPVSAVTQKPILPIYSETKGLKSRIIESLIEKALTLIPANIEFLPQELLQKYKLISLKSALYKIHHPFQEADIEEARKRLAFNELFLLSLRAQLAKKAWQAEGGIKIRFETDWVKDFLKTLPFKLTNSQKLAAWQIIKDLMKPSPMHRLLNGDVGSGKTIVAAIAALVAIKNGYQVALMAPTQILAEQHFTRLKKFFLPLNLKIELVTSYKKLKKEEADLIVGTHALLSPSVKFNQLGLVIVDEQHRFGVKQRQALKEKGGGRIPHLLSLTATPIPRTLALVIAGELDVSFLKEKPAGRKPITTRVVLPEKRAEIEKFVRKRLKKGEQAFVVVPLIGEEEIDLEKIPSLSLFPELDEKKSLEKEFQRLKKTLPEFRIAKLHGKMKPKEKTLIMSDFNEGKYDILVSTAVVEVGIDIKNATIMMIEDADRFGLAQLHQFRGRVGRGEKDSYCFLFLNRFTPEGYRRLKILENTEDGFKLAEEDLKMRGPGELYGTLQHGFLDLKMASLFNPELIEIAREGAEEILKTSPSLEKLPKLKEKLKKFEQVEHLE